MDFEDPEYSESDEYEQTDEDLSEESDCDPEYQPGDDSDDDEMEIEEQNFSGDGFEFSKDHNGFISHL